MITKEEAFTQLVLIIPISLSQPGFYFKYDLHKSVCLSSFCLHSITSVRCIKLNSKLIGFSNSQFSKVMLLYCMDALLYQCRLSLSWAVCLGLSYSSDPLFCCSLGISDIFINARMTSQQSGSLSLLDLMQSVESLQPPFIHPPKTLRVPLSFKEMSSDA